MMNLTIQLGRMDAHDEGARSMILNSFSLPVMEYARSCGLLSLMDGRLHLKMKAVKYSWQDKLKELVCSIVAGCEHTVSINHRLVPDTTLARELIGKDRFADQSGVNRLLHAFTEENIRELESVFERDYARNGLAWRLPKDEMVWVDLDMSGFRADGKTYEGAEKGYIGKKGARGYKASFAYVHERCREVLGCVFDGASASEIHHIDQLLELVKTRIGSPKVRDIVLRGDAAYGKASFVDRFVEEGYIFLLKYLPSNGCTYIHCDADVWVGLSGAQGGNNGLAQTGTDSGIYCYPGCINYFSTWYEFLPDQGSELYCPNGSPYVSNPYSLPGDSFFSQIYTYPNISTNYYSVLID